MPKKKREKNERGKGEKKTVEKDNILQKKKK
jgi:hypothetical protein